MPNSFFRFRQFTVHQERCAMKVSTDGVLLGAWTQCEGAQRVLDIGTGTGLLALMIAQRCQARIDAVEIDPDACEQAKENFQSSPWSERLQLVAMSFQAFCKTNPEPYELILSNPPYFSNSLRSADEKRNTARHNSTLLPKELITGVEALLKDQGICSLILPFDEGQQLIGQAEAQGLYCSRVTEVKGDREKSTQPAFVGT